MKLHNIGKKLHLNFRKFEKPTALCISILIIMTMLSIFATTQVHATTTTVTPALTVVGKQVIDSNGLSIQLKGVDYTKFIDSPTGLWSIPAWNMGASSVFDTSPGGDVDQ